LGNPPWACLRKKDLGWDRGVESKKVVQHVYLVGAKSIYRVAEKDKEYLRDEEEKNQNTACGASCWRRGSLHPNASQVFGYYLGLMSRISAIKDIAAVEDVLLEREPIFQRYELELWRRIAIVLTDRGDIRRLYNSGLKYIRSTPHHPHPEERIWAGRTPRVPDAPKIKHDKMKQFYMIDMGRKMW
jgi:hypothetical protein